MFKLEDHGQFAVVRIAVQFCKLRIGSPGFSHRNQIRFLKGLSAELPQEFMEPGTVVRYLLIRLLRNLIDYIQPEAAYTLSNPPVDHVIDFPAKLRILPV